MRKILLIGLLFLVSCNEPMRHIGQEIIDGKVSSIEPGHIGRFSTLPAIYVQDDKKTVRVEIPFAYEKRWNVGDSCLLIVEKYEIIKK
jgi:hypothetical protein